MGRFTEKCGAQLIVIIEKSNGSLALMPSIQKNYMTFRCIIYNVKRCFTIFNSMKIHLNYVHLAQISGVTYF